MNILVIHGPNLNQLHKRDASHYGSFTQEELFNHLMETFSNVEFTFYQSNYEGDVIEVLHESSTYDGILLNLGAWTHYSYAIRDALELTGLPSVDVHLSDILNREPFRRLNVLEGVSLKTFSGKKQFSYEEALDYLLTQMK